MAGYPAGFPVIIELEMSFDRVSLVMQYLAEGAFVDDNTLQARGLDSSPECMIARAANTHRERQSQLTMEDEEEYSHIY